MNGPGESKHASIGISLPGTGEGYGYFRVRYSTHAIGGLSENDFICAAKIDALSLAGG